jgi:hypothetical protein
MSFEIMLMLRLELSPKAFIMFMSGIKLEIQPQDFLGLKE